jgi:hypothetical protein
VASFQVHKETHDILKWVFDQTRIPDLIKSQEAGQLLEVSGVGSFAVEWHMSADMKTLKCMYGLKSGPNAAHCCIYCMQARKKQVATSVKQAEELLRKRGHSWEGGLFCAHIPDAPVLDGPHLDHWKPILPISLDRVHICTLHVLNRIVEKIVHLHFQFVWTIKTKSLQELAIKSMEKAISVCGAHGGNVKIFKDAELSGKSNSVPNKPSFSDANVKKLFGPSPFCEPSSGYPNAPIRPLWMDVVDAEHNRLGDRASRQARIALWTATAELQKYMTGLIFSKEQRRKFRDIVINWGQKYIDCFGEQAVTHYMVRYSVFRT